jgi:molybdenum cofactor cytidylyltransferase
MCPLRFGAIILGAGASSRMGEPKLLLPWGSTSIIGHLISVWRSVGAIQVAVVCAPPPHPVHAELDRLNFPSDSRIINPSPAIGMFSSIQSAARWTSWDPNLSHFAFALGDQPQISASLILTILKHAAENPDAICQPAVEKRPKHPVLIPRKDFLELASTTDATLRDFLTRTRSPRSFLEMADETLNIDLDSPADYRLAAERFSRSEN